MSKYILVDSLKIDKAFYGNHLWYYIEHSFIAYVAGYELDTSCRYFFTYT